eukprot:g13611.t1
MERARLDMMCRGGGGGGRRRGGAAGGDEQGGRRGREEDGGQADGAPSALLEDIGFVERNIEQARQTAGR